MGRVLLSVLLLILLGSPLSAEPGGAEFEKPVPVVILLLILLVSSLNFFDCCSDSLAVYAVFLWRARSTRCLPVFDCNGKGSMRVLHV